MFTFSIFLAVLFLQINPLYFNSFSLTWLIVKGLELGKTHIKGLHSSLDWFYLLCLNCSLPFTPKPLTNINLIKGVLLDFIGLSFSP